MTRAKLTRPPAPAPDENDAVGAALVGMGVGLLVFAFAPPEVKARIVGAIRRQLTTRPPAPAPVDLSSKHPGAIDVG